MREPILIALHILLQEPNEGLIRGVVAKLQAQGNADAKRLRNAIRRAIDLLSAALA